MKSDRIGIGQSALPVRADAENRVGSGASRCREATEPASAGNLFATTFFIFTAAVALYEMSRPPQPLPPQTGKNAGP